MEEIEDDLRLDLDRYTYDVAVRVENACRSAMHDYTGRYSVCRDLHGMYDFYIEIPMVPDNVVLFHKLGNINTPIDIMIKEAIKTLGGLHGRD